MNSATRIPRLCRSRSKSPISTGAGKPLYMNNLSSLSCISLATVVKNKSVESLVRDTYSKVCLALGKSTTASISNGINF